MMELIILPTGAAKCIYDEVLPLSRLGQISISRASHVEPNSVGNWIADLSPVGGPKLGPFENRTTALAAEVNWLKNNWLLSQD
jgi:hypothetical protein